MNDPVSTTLEFSAMGPPGAIIAMLSAFIYFLIREHRSERAEWIEAYKEGNDRWANQMKESSRVWEETQKTHNELLTRIFLEHENTMKNLKEYGFKS